MLSEQKKGNDKKTILLSLLFATFLDIKTINAYITKGAEEGGYMATLYILVIGGIVAASLFYRCARRLPNTVIFITAFLCVLYLLTSFLSGPPRVSPPFFAVFTISSFLIPHFVHISSRWTLKLVMVLSAPAILHINQIFTFQALTDNTISMGLCYAFLTPIVASIIYMFFYYKKESFFQKIITIILFAINIVFLFYLFVFGSRGPLVAIFSLILILFTARVTEKRRGVTFNKKRIRLCIFLGAFIVISWVSVFNWMNDYLASNGINLRFVEKMIQLDEAGDVSNGRTELYELAIIDFLHSPIWGRGLDRFSANHQVESYPHNFILQILCDGGLLLFLILFVPIMKKVRYIVKNCSIERYAILITLFFSSVPGALFSGDLWECNNLWLLFGAILSNHLVSEQNE